MPRPKLPPANRKTRNIIFRVSEADYLRLAQNAEAVGMSVHELARMLTFTNEAKITIETHKKTDPVMVKRFDRLANNLNQLVKNSHIFGRISPQVDGLCELIAEIVCEVAEKELDE
ncbi:hypothetical protein MLD52_09575 [Puniceicoccaceae bacterium K14]|nr:hypothetical protein [Puniceicoccaceae bacterium K14]